MATDNTLGKLIVQVKRIADALDRAHPPTDASFTNVPRRLTGRVESGETIMSRDAVQVKGAEFLRHLNEQPQAEGDWLLETERAEAGDDVD